MIGELIVADQCAVGLTARRAVFGLVDLLEEVALVELDRLFQVLADLVLGGRHHLDLELGAGLRILDQVMKAAIAPLQLLKIRVVKHGGELFGNHRVELVDGILDRPAQVLLPADVLLFDLVRQVLQ